MIRTAHASVAVNALRMCAIVTWALNKSSLSLAQGTRERLHEAVCVGCQPRRWRPLLERLMPPKPL
jgi:hypothetical protein